MSTCFKTVSEPKQWFGAHDFVRLQVATAAISIEEDRTSGSMDKAVVLTISVSPGF